MSREIMTPQIIGGIYPLPFCQPPAPWMGVLCPPASSPGVLGLAAHGRRWGSTFGAHPKTGVSFCRRVPPPPWPWGNIWPLGRATGTEGRGTPCSWWWWGAVLGKKHRQGIPGPLGEDTGPLKGGCPSLGVATGEMRSLWEGAAYPLGWLGGAAQPLGGGQSP